MEYKPYLRVEKVNKTFPGVRALVDVDLMLAKGEVLGLVGINGAGKSTLMNVISGLYTPESGKIYLDDQEVKITNPSVAQKLGIGMIHQEAVVFEYMSVAENMFINKLDEFKHGLKMDYKEMQREAEKYFKELGSEIDTSLEMSEVTIGERQMTEIGRALAMGSEIILFDEPTSSLTIKEKEILFDVIRRLKAQNKAIIYISHSLEEVMDICDSIQVMRDGHVIKRNIKTEVTVNDIVEQMIGHKVENRKFAEKTDPNDLVLRVTNLNCGKLVKNSSFELRKGEILGFWGLLGAGRTEHVRAMFALDQPKSGTVEIMENGEWKKIKGAELLRRCGYVTENRHDDGLFMPMPLYKNVSAAVLDRYTSKIGLMKGAGERETMNEYIDLLKIKTPGPNVLAEQLSGGNQQKTIVARWLNKDSEIYVFDEPTRGVDVNAKSEIHQLIIDIAKRGNSVILISSEIEEILNLSSRVIVINEGEITASVEGDEINQNNLTALCVKKKEEVC